MRLRLNFILLHVKMQLSQHHWVTRLFSLHWVDLAPLSKSAGQRCIRLILIYIICFNLRIQILLWMNSSSFLLELPLSLLVLLSFLQFVDLCFFYLFCIFFLYHLVLNYRLHHQIYLLVYQLSFQLGLIHYLRSIY